MRALAYVAITCALLLLLHACPVSAASHLFAFEGWLEPHTDGVRIGWVSSGANAPASVTLQRLSFLDGTWSSIRSGGRAEVFVDNAVLPDTLAAYRFVLASGAVIETTAVQQIELLRRPRLLEVTIRPAHSILRWESPSGLLNASVQRRVQDAVWIGVAPVTVIAPDTLLFDQFDDTTLDPYELRLAWVESDGGARFGEPIVVQPESTDAELLTVEFLSHRIRMRFRIVTPDSTARFYLNKTSLGVPSNGLIALRPGPDSTVTCVDEGLDSSRPYSYVFGGPALSRRARDLQIFGWTAPDPPPARLTPHLDRIEAVWYPEHARSWSVAIERRVDAGPWAELATRVVDRDTLAWTDTTTTPGRLYAYRLRWLEEGDTLRSAVAQARPPVPAAKWLDSRIAPGHVRLHYEVTPEDAPFAWRVLRRPIAGGDWDSIGVLRQVRRGDWFVDDDTPSDGTSYVYRVAWPLIAGTSHSEDYTAVVSSQPSGLLGPFPNPAHGEVRFAMVLPDDGWAELRVIDIAGRVRWTQRIAGGAPTSIGIARGTIEPGLYLMRATGSFGVVTRRFVVLP